jgi:hypothetical protein
VRGDRVSNRRGPLRLGAFILSESKATELCRFALRNCVSGCDEFAKTASSALLHFSFGVLLVGVAGQLLFPSRSVEEDFVDCSDSVRESSYERCHAEGVLVLSVRLDPTSSVLFVREHDVRYTRGDMSTAQTGPN